MTGNGEVPLTAGVTRGLVNCHRPVRARGVALALWWVVVESASLVAVGNELTAEMVLCVHRNLMRNTQSVGDV